MLSEYISTPEALKRVQSGVAGSHLAGFVAWLESARYAVRTVRPYVLAVGHFIIWATAEGLQASKLDDGAIEGFAAHLKRCRCRGFRGGRYAVGLTAKFVCYLRQQGIVPPLQVKPGVSAEPELLTGFRRWMAEVRGSRESTLSGYSYVIRELLQTLGDDPSRYDAQGLRRFIRGWCRDGLRKDAKHTTTPVRMFLRYLSSEQKCSAALVGAVPSVAQWELASLPQYLSAHAVEQVIQATEHSRHPLRNRAIILLLYYLAFRAGDIIRLKLGDIAWRRGVVRTCGKERRESELPLTQEVGEALEAYIVRERPAVAEERVFLRNEAPFRPLASAPTVSAIVRLTMLRAGLETPSYGAHILRRSAATQMLSNGASLAEIGTILRHKSTHTTLVYAKVDFPSLKLVTQPWPEVPSC